MSIMKVDYGDVGGEVEPIAEELTITSGDYTLTKDYKYLLAYTWGGDYTSSATLNGQYADAKIYQNNGSAMVWYNVKSGDVYHTVTSSTNRLIGFA